MTEQGLRRLALVLGGIGVGMLMTAGAVMVFTSGEGGPVETVPQRAPAPGRLVAAPEPVPVPPLAFTDSAGRPAALADFAGRVVLLNLWATWCAPCVRELPSLDRLQTALGGPDFQVVALALDRGGGAVVGPFLERLKVSALSVYFDSTGEASRTLGSLGLPTTLLIDRQGREVGRMLGGTEWDSAEMRRSIETLIARPPG